MTINKEIVKEKWEKTKKFVKDHPLQIAAGVGAVAGLYFGFKCGEWHRGRFACTEAIKEIPELMRKYGECGFRSVMAWAKDHTPEAKKVIDDYFEAHVDDEDFKDVSFYFWENDTIKKAIEDVNDFAKANHLKVRI